MSFVSLWLRSIQSPIIPVCLPIVTLTFFTSASALPFSGRTPDNKLTPSDAANLDRFGSAVSISGNRGIVGTPDKDGAGAAYVFDMDSGAELRKLTASDAQGGDSFGTAVAISGNRAVVGAFGEDGDGISNRGAAYVFDTESGAQLFKLTASDTEDGDQFGNSVAVSGDLAIIGAIGEDGPNAVTRGAAYVFDVTSGAELFKLTPSDGQGGDRFGVSVSISGNFAIVGADGEDGENSEGGEGNNRGAAYVFDLTTGSESFKLVASDTQDNDFFGAAVAISGGLAIVGAEREDGSGGSSAERGAAYVFDVTTGTEVRKLIPSDTADGY